LTTARQQGALLWELRSARHLARLRVGQKRPQEAWQILAPVYGQFVEGFETADLRAAKLMLESLSETRPLSAGSPSQISKLS
jgi:predicted ATPase